MADMSRRWREIEGAVLEERDELWRVILEGVRVAEVPDAEEGTACVYEILRGSGELSRR
jgi:hypothetical protein